MIKKLVGLLACTLILGSSFAMAGVPDLEESTAVTANPGDQLLLYSRLDATGTSFEGAVEMTGFTATSAVVTLMLRDAGGAAIVNYPFEDMWIGARDGGLVACPGGNLADFSTDATGMTEWRLPMAAGGFSNDLAQVFINGDALTSAPGMNLYFISADNDGNLEVGLNDLSNFSSDYYAATYQYRSDYDLNGEVGLNDLSEFSTCYYGINACVE